METIPLKQSEMTSALLPKKNVEAMIAAIKGTNLFVVETDREAGTVLVYGKTSKKEVLRAIEKGANQPWIVVHHKELFS